MPINKIPNRLINEKSPYLLQHVYTPVNWFPWSDEAFQKSKEEDKPIFLSIGYNMPLVSRSYHFQKSRKQSYEFQ